MASTSVTLSTLQQTIARATERFPRERPRIERAATLIALGHVSQVTADTFAVRSQTDVSVTYTVTAGSYAVTASGCGCVDAVRHPGQSCKHAWDVDLVQVATEHQRRLEARERARTEPAVVLADAVAPASPTVASPSDALHEAFVDWTSRRAYVDGRGNYRLHEDRRKIARWNKAVKQAFKDVSEFHAAAMAYTEQPSTPSATSTTGLREHLGAQDIRRLTLFKWRYSLESAGFTPRQADSLLFLKWCAARQPVAQ